MLRDQYTAEKMFSQALRAEGGGGETLSLSGVLVVVYSTDLCQLSCGGHLHSGVSLISRTIPDPMFHAIFQIKRFSIYSESRVTEQFMELRKRESSMCFK
jgi:hypothetical protein